MPDKIGDTHWKPTQRTVTAEPVVERNAEGFLVDGQVRLIPRGEGQVTAGQLCHVPRQEPFFGVP